MKYDKSSEVESDGPEEHEISCGVDTILRAEEIKNNDKLWPHVSKALKAKGESVNKAIRSLKDLEDVAYEKTREAAEEDPDKSLKATKIKPAKASV